MTKHTYSNKLELYDEPIAIKNGTGYFFKKTHVKSFVSANILLLLGLFAGLITWRANVNNGLEVTKEKLIVETQSRIAADSTIKSLEMRMLGNQLETGRKVDAIVDQMGIHLRPLTPTELLMLEGAK